MACALLDAIGIELNAAVTVVDGDDLNIELNIMKAIERFLEIVHVGLRKARQTGGDVA